ncbi:MAG: flagellar protein FlaG [Candidatus Riflebacteria bacterium]|nr:flagellar protein FlaG [Candidatus Riflebacteria bacterium]
MGIESINSNLNVNAGSFSNYKSNVDVPSSPEAPEIEKPELQDVQLMSTKAAENFSDESEEQKEKLENAIKKLNETAKVFNRSLKFKMHEATHRTMISVIDTDTDKVIREIPGEEALDMVAKMQEYLGLIFDKKA